MNLVEEMALDHLQALETVPSHPLLVFLKDERNCRIRIARGRRSTGPPRLEYRSFLWKLSILW